MNDFLNSVKDDLLDSRLRVVVLAVAAALIAAVAFIVLGGSSSTTTAPASTGPVTAEVAGIAIRQAPSNAEEPVAETTNGAAQQRGGPTRDPFAPLPESTAPGATAAKTPAPATPASTSGSSGSGSSSGSSTSSPTTPAATPTPSTPKKSKVYVHYHVTAKFGVLPAPTNEATPAPVPQLKTYADMPVDEPLPNKSNTQLVFMGVLLRTGKEAVFALTGEAILHGNATCVPSATQCQAIRLAPGQSETLESIEPNGSPVTYELRLVSIARTESSASAARAHVAIAGGQPRVGRELLQRDGLATVPGLEYSPGQGGYVLPGQPVFNARAHVAAQPRRHGR
jgi:hypothetical protein